VLWQRFELRDGAEIGGAETDRPLSSRPRETFHLGCHSSRRVDDPVQPGKRLDVTHLPVARSTDPRAERHHTSVTVNACRSPHGGMKSSLPSTPSRRPSIRGHVSTRAGSKPPEGTSPTG